MSDINSVIVVGRLTRDAELKYTGTGTAISTFSIASNRSVSKGDKWESVASFFDITLFGKRGESLKPYLTKGQQVCVAGELRQDRWTDKEGQNHSKVSIVANDIQLVGSRQEQQPAAASAPQPPAQQEFQDDIPF